MQSSWNSGNVCPVLFLGEYGSREPGGSAVRRNSPCAGTISGDRSVDDILIARQPFKPAHALQRRFYEHEKAGPKKGCMSFSFDSETHSRRDERQAKRTALHPP